MLLKWWVKVYSVVRKNGVLIGYRSESTDGINSKAEDRFRISLVRCFEVEANE